MIPHSLLVILVFLSGATALHAQSEAPPAEEELGGLSARFVTSFTPGNDEIFYLKDGQDYTEMLLAAENISRPIPLPGSRLLILYQKTLNEEGLEVYVPVIEKILKGSGMTYLILLNRTKDSAYHARVYGLTQRDFPIDQISIINGTPATLGLSVNEAAIVVKANETQHYDLTEADRHTYTSAKVLMRYKGKSKVMASKRLRLIPGRRVILICIPSRGRAEMGATPLRMITYQDMPSN